MARKVSEYCTLSHKAAQPAHQCRLCHEDYFPLPTRGCFSSAASSRHQARPTPQAHLPTDELHDIGKSSRQDLAVEMLQDITPATRTKFLAQRRIAIQFEYLGGQVF